MKNFSHYLFILFGLVGVGILMFFLPNLQLHDFAYWSYLAIFTALVLAVAFRHKVFWLLVIAPPTLVLGQFITFRLSRGWSYEASMAELLLALTALIVIFNKSWREKIWQKVRGNGFAKIFIVYLLLSASTILYQIYDMHFFIGMNKIIFFGLIAYLLSLTIFDDFKKIRYFITSLAVTAGLLSVQIFIKFYEIGFSNKLFFERSQLVLPFGPIAVIAAALAMILPILIAYYFSAGAKSKAKPIIFVGICLSLLAIFLILGKAAIISLLLGFIYLFIKLEKKRVGVILFFLLFAIICFIIFSPFFTGLLERFGNFFTDINVQSRVVEYRLSWRLFADHYWLGIGSGQQPAYFGRVLNYEYAESSGYSLLQAMAIDLGLPGLIIMATMIFLTVKKSFRLARSFLTKDNFYIHGFIASLIVALANGFMAEATIYVLPYALIFWPIMGIFFNLKESAAAEKQTQ